MLNLFLTFYNLQLQATIYSYELQSSATILCLIRLFLTDHTISNLPSTFHNLHSVCLCLFFRYFFDIFFFKYFNYFFKSPSTISIYNLQSPSTIYNLHLQPTSTTYIYNLHTMLVDVELILSHTLPYLKSKMYICLKCYIQCYLNSFLPSGLKPYKRAVPTAAAVLLHFVHLFQTAMTNNFLIQSDRQSYFCDRCFFF